MTAVLDADVIEDLRAVIAVYKEALDQAEAGHATLQGRIDSLEKRLENARHEVEDLMETVARRR